MSSQFVVAIGVGVLMTWAIERPFLRIRNRVVGSDPIPVRADEPQSVAALAVQHTAAE